MSDENNSASENSGNAAQTDPGTPPAQEQANNGSSRSFDFQDLSAYSAEQQEFLKTKGYKDVPALIESYRNLEKSMGGRVALPKDTDDDSVWADFYKKAGVPESVEGYGIKPTSDFANDLLQVAHKINLTKRQAEQFLKISEEGLLAGDRIEAENFKKNVEAAKEAWGDKAAANTDLLQRAKNAYGLTDGQYQEVAEVLGFDKATSILLSLGRQNADGVSGGSSGSSGDNDSDSMVDYLMSKRNARVE